MADHDAPKKPTVGIVKWGNPWKPDRAPKWGLRVNGAYVSSGGKVLLFARRSEALAARSEIKRRLGEGHHA